MLRQFIIAFGLLVAGLAQAGEAGRIVFVTGQAHVASRAAALGEPVQEGDDLITGADGYIYLKTVDNGFLILRPSSRARIVAYHIDAENPSNTHVKLELQSGVARTISGQGVKQARQNFRFNTPVAAIGVRGTDFTVFTDQETSRVAVISGGVVVSGFSGVCGPEGTGPCEGSASRELFAGQNEQLLQIRKGQVTPQLLHGNGIAPDLTAPPRNDEPVSKASTGNSALAANDVSLEPQKSEILLSSNIPSIPEVPPVPVVTPEVPPVVDPVPVPKSPPEVLWGRWEKVARLAPDAATLAKLNGGDYALPHIVGSFFISRLNNSELTMPNSGSAGFTLVNSEAYIAAAGKAPVSAVIQNARLDLDFGLQAFSTSLSVVSPSARVDLYAKGDVTLNGELVSDIMRSNATVRGYLGGAGAQEAGYIFRSTDSPTLSAFGATQWAK